MGNGYISAQLAGVPNPFRTSDLSLKRQPYFPIHSPSFVHVPPAISPMTSGRCPIGLPILTAGIDEHFICALLDLRPRTGLRPWKQFSPLQVTREGKQGGRREPPLLIMGVTGKSGSRGIAEDLRERVFGAVKDEGVEDRDGIE